MIRMVMNVLLLRLVKRRKLNEEGDIFWKFLSSVMTLRVTLIYNIFGIENMSLGGTLSDQQTFNGSTSGMRLSKSDQNLFQKIDLVSS